MDGGIFEGTLRPRRTITIADKLKVIAYYQKMKREKDKQEEEKALQAGVKRKRSDVDSSSQEPSTNLQHLCELKFPDIVGKCIVKRWVMTAARERWLDLPKHIRSRLTSTPNGWRHELGLSKRGRREGGCIPEVLQVELDKLICDMVAGASEVTERKEVVTAEDVDS